ncbi:ABC transporter ATP-binding protein [Alkalicoccobacillus plakortidis]|uniref:ABC transporter ATP-binding protein n=1 Tax=Alkalicoccobacillus plakortidis TaxID=444060 RepID=A0ABT0XIU8_9BACI|nr:ABC transporter ATP-binding protein [Alkalicoccobacillus plakortidis]MCM2675640.1 ABC transporter ATP-binding protein [Alkalicoccobacillus plakortidis]
MRIKLHNLNKTYQSGIETTRVLRDIDLVLESGSWLTITGPSGSGKTTLMRCLSAIEKADSGNARLGQLDVMVASEEERRQFRRNHLGYIFQDFQLFQQFDVLTNVMIPLLPYQARITIERKAKELLETVGLSHRSHHMPSQLSGGEKQRVAIARALMNDPQLLLCDEPTGNLDLENRNKIMETIKQIHRQGVTVVLVTHDPELAQFGDILYEMRDGELRRKESMKTRG